MVGEYPCVRRESWIMRRTRSCFGVRFMSLVPGKMVLGKMVLGKMVRGKMVCGKMVCGKMVREQKRRLGVGARRRIGILSVRREGRSDVVDVVD